MYQELTEPERYTLSVLKGEGRSVRSIAKTMQRSLAVLDKGEAPRNHVIPSKDAQIFGSL